MKQQILRFEDDKEEKVMILLLKDLFENTFEYLGQYYLRNNSESGFSADKRWFGWKVLQRREDRIDTAVTCTNIWHNMLNLFTD